MVKGYGGRKPGTHRSGFGNGIFLHVAKDGKSTWHVRFKLDGKDVSRRVETANQSCDLNRAKALSTDVIARARRGEMPSGRVKTLSTDSLGTHFTEWADAKLSSESWSKRHHKKSLETAEQKLGDLWFRPTNAINRRELIEQLEGSGSADRAGRLFNWLDEMYEELMNRDVLQSKPIGKKPSTLKPKKGKGFPSFGLKGVPKLIELYHRIRLADEIDASSRLCHQTMILIGSRNTASRWLEKGWVDFKKKEIVFPRSLQKKDDEERGDFIVPMSPQLIAVMNEAMERADRLETPYLFPSFRRRAPNEDGIIEPVIDMNGLSKLMRDWTGREHSPHGNRKCLVSWAVENLDIEEHVAKALLDHDPFSGALKHYNTAQFVQQRRAVLDAWGKLFEVRL